MDRQKSEDRSQKTEVRRQKSEVYLSSVLCSLSSVLLCIFGILFVKGCVKKPPIRAKVVLRSSLAGKWYPADANTLSEQIATFFQNAEVEPKNNVIGLILPHAGYAFSGQTAVCGLSAAGRLTAKTTDQKYKRIVIIGPSHYVSMEEVLSVPRVTHYETLLGQIPLDVEFVEKLLKYWCFRTYRRRTSSNTVSR